MKNSPKLCMCYSGYQQSLSVLYLMVNNCGVIFQKLNFIQMCYCTTFYKRQHRQTQVSTIYYIVYKLVSHMKSKFLGVAKQDGKRKGDQILPNPIKNISCLKDCYLTSLTSHNVTSTSFPNSKNTKAKDTPYLTSISESKKDE